MADINLTHTGAQLDEAIAVALSGGGAVANSIVITEVDANKRITKVDVSSFTEIYPQMFANSNADSGIYIYLNDIVFSSEPIIGQFSFDFCNRLVLSSLPSGVISIGAYAFRGCTGLTLSALPSELIAINDYTFYGCTYIALSALPNGVENVGSYAFYGCSRLVLSSFSTALKTIGDNAFRGCTSIVATSFSTGLTSISSSAFRQCTALTKLWIPATCLTIQAAGATAAPFYQCTSTLILYCEAASKPAGWGSYFDNYGASTKLTVNWGVTKEAFDAL